jgi:FtsH-binding integral membrane protein
MAELRNFQTGTQSGVMVDQGLRSYMLKVYNLMMFGVAITGVAAYVTTLLTTTNDASQAAATMRGGVMLTQLGVALYTSPLQWVVMLAPLALVFFLSFRIDKMSVSAAQGTFWAYAALLGVSLSSILLVYTAASITQTFFVTAASFGALSLYGYTTKRDLSGMGSFLIMGLFGIILASIVNIFLKSSGIEFAISIIGVLVFAGLTAWDTQKIKELYFEGDDDVTYGRKAVMGALTLYMDFINLFLFLLRFLGNNRN